METLSQDLRYALRMLARTPAFTAVAVLTIALGIGANTAIFSIVNAVMMRTLPVERPEELAVVGNPAAVHWSSSGSPRTDLFSEPLYRELERNNEVFTSLAAAGSPSRMRVSIGDAQQEGQPARVRIVTGNYFSLLGVKPLLGRVLTPEDDRAAGSAPYAVISYGFWTKQFGSKPDVVGTTVRVSGFPLTVVGVTPPGFFGEVVGERQDLWVPMVMQPSIMPGYDRLKKSDKSWLLLIGRMKPGVTLEQAQANMTLTLRRIAESGLGTQMEQGDREHLQEDAIPVSEGGKGFSSLRRQFRAPLILLTAIVALVLLIACINVATLLLARSSARQTEIAVRLAIGASSGRIVRQVITECLVLAFFGGVAGIVASIWASEAMLRIVSTSKSVVGLDVRPDTSVLAFTFVLTVITGVLFGLAPALRLRNVDLSPALKPNVRTGGASGPARTPVSKILVVGQLALSVLVLFSAMVLVRSLRNLQEVDTGYERDRLLLVGVDVLATGKSVEQLPSAYNELVERVRRIPGVTSVTFSENGLFTGSSSSTSILIDGVRPQEEKAQVADTDLIAPGYFSTLGIPVLEGRDIQEQDGQTSARVTVVNESLARLQFPNGSAIGHKIAIDAPEDSSKPYEIVGVVADTRGRTLREPIEPRFYMPYAQTATRNGRVFLSIRTSGDPASVTEAVRRTVMEFDPKLPIPTVETLRGLMGDLLVEQMVIARLTAIFAALALLLACIGLYGVMSYAVAGRTKEIGVRMAMGASRGDVLWLIMRDACAMIAFGVALGIPLATLASRGMRSMMYGVGALDPAVIASTTVVLGAVGLIAAYVPARRAMKVDPMVALRYE